ncbi:hypothetical protein FNV43_RR00508 [Rhamnella rubrinervis]|uniref:Uncharacterized protein n=1 Tax=Rhamnella rubrinervis TaxID=2594499 RepID=A0A8K0HMY7_9ROSA|nr:hypothetical protein FNV43_RR00508 [Rhamnella rubrinervis]
MLAEQSFKEEDPSTQQFEQIPEGIPLPVLEVPYLHVLEGYIRLLYGVSTDPLWASYPTVDIGKLKMKISNAELEATKKKKKDKQAASKGEVFQPPNPNSRRGEREANSTDVRTEGRSTIRSDTMLIGPIVDSLMTRHNHSILKEMTLDEIGLEAKQSALKLAQDARYLYDADACNNVVAANKTLEEDILALKQTAMEASK